MPHNRPRDRDLAKQLVRELRREADLPVVFLAAGGAGGHVISEGIGLRPDGVRGISLQVGEGLGGRVIRDKRPGVVSDYASSKTITDRYREQVGREGLGPVFAVPILSGTGETRMILYGAHRASYQFGDDIRTTAMQLANRGATELRIRDEVDRRVDMATGTTADLEQSGDRASAADVERLRELHADLRAIAATIDDPEARERLLAASGGLAAMLNPRTSAHGDGPLFVPGGGGAVAAGEDAAAGPGGTAGRAAGGGAVGAAGAGAGAGLADAPGGDPNPEAPVLTPRELDVLAQVALGCTNAEAAQRLSLSVETIKAYLRNASSKLGVSGRHAAVSRARALGLLP